MQSLYTASTGMLGMQTQIDTTANNIANVNTVRTADGGGPYRRKDVIFEARPETRNFGEILTQVSDTNVQRVGVIEMVDTQKEPLLKYEPDHPEADADGYVYGAPVDVDEEMVEMMEASRQYQNNLEVVTTLRALMMRTVNMGK